MSRRFCVAAGWLLFVGLMLLPVCVALDVNHYPADGAVSKLVGNLLGLAFCYPPLLLLAAGVLKVWGWAGRRFHGRV